MRNFATRIMNSTKVLITDVAVIFFWALAHRATAVLSVACGTLKTTSADLRSEKVGDGEGSVNMCGRGIVWQACRHTR